METRFRSFKSILKEAVFRLGGPAGDPHLEGGFLIGSSLLGLLVIIGAFWYHRSNLSLFKRSCIMTITSQENHFRSIQIVHRSLMFLLIMNAVNLIGAIIVGAEMMFGKFCYDEFYCFHVGIVWSLSRWFGVTLHLRSALLSICHLHQPLSETKIHIICVLFGIIAALFVFILGVAIFTLAVFQFVFALAIILEFRVSTSSPSTATLKKLIMLVAMCNFLVVYVPTFILQCLIIFCPFGDEEFVDYVIAYVNIQVFTNHRLIFDGFLCALVLKLPSGEEQQQQHQKKKELISSNPGFTASVKSQL